MYFAATMLISVAYLAGLNRLLYCTGFTEIILILPSGSVFLFKILYIKHVWCIRLEILLCKLKAMKYLAETCISPRKWAEREASPTRSCYNKPYFLKPLFLLSSCCETYEPRWFLLLSHDFIHTCKCHQLTATGSFHVCFCLKSHLITFVPARSQVSGLATWKY